MDLLKNSKLSQEEKKDILKKIFYISHNFRNQLLSEISPFMDIENDKYFKSRLQTTYSSYIQIQSDLDSYTLNVQKEITELKNLEEKETWNQFLKIVKQLSSIKLIPRKTNIDPFNTKSLYAAFYSLFMKIEKSGLLKYGISQRGPYSQLISAASQYDFFNKFENYFLNKAKKNENQRVLLVYLIGSENVTLPVKEEALNFLTGLSKEEQTELISQMSQHLRKINSLPDPLFTKLVEVGYRDSYLSFQRILNSLSRYNRNENPRYVIYFDKKRTQEKNVKRRLFFTSLLLQLQSGKTLESQLLTQTSQFKKCHEYFPTAAHIALANKRKVNYNSTPEPPLQSILKLTSHVH